jgi:very-short-patch-repair endonuclease
LSRHEQERGLARIAAHQDALVTLLQARAVGLTEWAVRRRVAAGRWEQVLPGVYKIVGAPTTDRQRVRAAQLWAGGSAVLSHRSAGWLWGFDGMRAPALPEVTVPRRRGPSSELVVVHRTLVLPDVDRREILGLPVTSAARTIVDLAAVLDEEALEIAMESGFRLGFCRESFLRWRLQELGGPGRAGSTRLRRILDGRGKGAAPLEFPLEVKMWRFLKKSRLPRPVRQHEVRISGRRYRIDFAWPDRKVALECDGYDTHGGRVAFRRDRRKLAALSSDGWLVIPVTWDDATKRPNEKLSELSAALQRAA